GPPVRGALRLARRGGDRRERDRRSGEGQARVRPDDGQRGSLTVAQEIAPAKLNLALHVRGRLPDGRHAIETIFAFCIDGDRLSGEPAETISLETGGPF